MTESYPITGIPTRILNVSDRPLPQPLRQELDDWYLAVDDNGNKTNEIQINLFLLALTKFQAMDVPDLLSYFRVAGIHAQPRVAWDEPNNGPKSYCAHGRILFPPWHRPYLLLYEQRLYEIMLDEIKKFPTDSQAELRKQAAAWRLPYWDWAAKRPPPFPSPVHSTITYRLPLIARMEEVDITFGHGPNEATTTERRPNPMYKFSTPKAMGDYGDYRIPSVNGYPYDISRATSRYPPKPDESEASIEAWVYGVENNDKVDEALQGTVDASNLGEATARIFATPRYNEFASTAYLPKGDFGHYMSLETVHNSIHRWVGGPGGYMAQLAVAAFDPIFWMHHNNIDRLFAIWQTLHPDAWFEPIIGADNSDKSSSPLHPFHIDKINTLYTPDLSRDWFKLHYSYPELQPWLDKYYNNRQFNESLYLDDIRSQIKTLYLPRVITPLRLSGYESGKEFTDYVVNVIYERHALGGASYTIHIFLKDIQNPPKDAKPGRDGEPATRVELGSVFNFSSPDDRCENCRQQEAAGQRSRAQVSITSALLEELILPWNHPWSKWEDTDVESYLVQHLDWTVTKGFGEEVPLDSIPSLNIFVVRGKAIHHAEPGKLSEYKDYEVLYKVTEGKLGGLKHNYAF